MDDEKNTTLCASPSLSLSAHDSLSIHLPHTPRKVNIIIGKAQQSYSLCELQLLSYFEAMFSTRWRFDVDDDDDDDPNETSNESNTAPTTTTSTEKNTTNNNSRSITIGDNKCLSFGLEELSCLIHIKKHKRIPCGYSFRKLIMLCAAAAFFSEDVVNEELIVQFFKKCKPSLCIKDLQTLSKCNPNGNQSNRLVRNCAGKYLRNIGSAIANMRNKWLEQYKRLPIAYVDYDNDMIAQIFVRSFSIQWVKQPNETQRQWMMQCGSSNAFFHVWDAIKKRQLFKCDRNIFECIEKMCNDIDISVPVHHSVHESVLVILNKVFIDVMQIVTSFHSHNRLHRTNSNASRPVSSKFITSFPSQDEQKHDASNDVVDQSIEVHETTSADDSNNLHRRQETQRYDYHRFNLQELIRTHLEFVIVNRKKHFGIDELKRMTSIAKSMHGVQKYGFLKTLLSFHGEFMDNMQRAQSKALDECVMCWKNLIKYLISSDVDYSISCVSQWLPILIEESKFVLNVVAPALSTDGSHKLGFAIANYATSDAVVRKKIDGQYMQYLSSSLGLFWKMNQTLTDMDHDLEAHDVEEFDAAIECRSITLTDSNMFNL